MKVLKPFGFLAAGLFALSLVGCGAGSHPILPTNTAPAQSAGLHPPLPRSSSDTTTQICTGVSACAALGYGSNTLEVWKVTVSGTVTMDMIGGADGGEPVNCLHCTDNGDGTYTVDCDADPTNRLCNTYYQLATIDPTSDAQCDGSPYHLGTSNMPGSTSGRATTVQNIFAFENSNGQVYAWLYQTVNEDLFFQRNQANIDTNALSALLSQLGIPGIDDLLNALESSSTSPYQITGTQASSIEYGLQHGGYKVHDCFTSPLTIA